MGAFERGVTTVLVLWIVVILLGYGRDGAGNGTRPGSEAHR
jgi:hypothetical protein